MNIRLKKEDQVTIKSIEDIYSIMQRILKRENRIDRNREHFWTISLDNADKILNIELVSMGSINRTIVEPMEVFSVPLQKRAVRIVLVHNHPSGRLEPSHADKEVTDQLIQCGKLLNVKVADHVIISEQAYYSFLESGLMAVLVLSKKYVPEYKRVEALKKEVEKISVRKGEMQKARAMAKAMKQKGEPVEKIVEYTGLSKQVIDRIKA